MDGPPSRASIIRAIAVKDIQAFTRDRFWLFMTALALGWFGVIYYFLPDTVNETITVGVYWTEREEAYDLAFPSAADGGREDAEAVGIAFERFDSVEALEEALGLGEEAPDEPLDLGVAFPEDFLVRVVIGEPTEVRLYVDPLVPEEVRQAIAMYVRESAYQLVGYTLPVSEPDPETVVLGEDRAGQQVTLREKMVPLYAFVMLMMETFALGALIATEVSSRSVTAVLATPARVADFLTAKGLVGTGIAFAEAALLMLLVRAFSTEPLILAAALLLGAMLATGIALIVGSTGRDFISMIFFSMLFLVPLMIPAMAELFPGTASAWVKVLPTYGLVQAIVGITSYGYGWSETLPYLAVLAAWCVVIFATGWIVLARKVQTL